MSIKEAAAQGVERLRRTIWALPEDHLKIDIIDGAPGPWAHLYSPLNPECNGRDPIDISCISLDYDQKDWVPYSGPLPDSDAYVAAVKRFRM